MNDKAWANIQDITSKEGPQGTMRDYFAGMAMQRYIDQPMTYESIASFSYQIADAMIKERKK